MGKDDPLQTDGSLPPVALIAGPTASGKSELALQLAERLIAGGRAAVIINADSAQLYRDLQVLSARPSDDEMRGVPHRLFGDWDGAVACSAADWAAAARLEISAAHVAGALPILVGGTGLYIRTLLDGIAPVPQIDATVRETVRAMDAPALHAALLLEDAAAAIRLNPADTTRMARALEVVRSTGKPLAHWQAVQSGGIANAITLHPLILLPERKWLYSRCDQRFAAMIDAGAIAEVEALLARQLDPALPVMRAIGMAEISAMLAGTISHEAMISAASQATRNYAKRQYTWMRNQPPAGWRNADPAQTQLSTIIDMYFERLLRF